MSTVIKIQAYRKLVPEIGLLGGCEFFHSCEGPWISHLLLKLPLTDPEIHISLFPVLLPHGLCKL